MVDPEVLKAYERFFDTPDGQIIAKDLQERVINRASHTPGDPYETAYQEGRRAHAREMIARTRTARMRMKEREERRNA